MRENSDRPIPSSDPDGFIVRILTSTAVLSGRHPRTVLVLGLLLAILSVSFAMHRLGITTDTSDMLSRELEYRRVYEDYKQAFPGNRGKLVSVIDAPTPEMAEDAADRLAVVLRSEALFEKVERPGADTFFIAHAFLFLDEADLSDLSNRLLQMEPLLRKMIAGPDLPGFFQPVGEAIEGSATGDAVRLTGADNHSAELEPLFRALDGVFSARLENRPYQLSWRNLMDDTSRDTMTSQEGADRGRALVTCQTNAQGDGYGRAEEAMEKIREAARVLAIDAPHGLNLRLTGEVALDGEELKSAAESGLESGWLCFLLVSIFLFWALNSRCMVIASIVTLAVGLAWTIGFVGAAVGHLNLISAAFAAIYIGLGIDYTVHFCLRYGDQIKRDGLTHIASLRSTASEMAGPLALCATTTAVGFYSFIPTDYKGVSELGLIGGTSMFISLLATFTILPALLSMMPLSPPSVLPVPGGPPEPAAPARAITGPLRLLPAATVLLAVIALVLLPQVTFDYNPMNLRDPHSESVATYHDLAAHSRSASSIVLLARNADAAEAEAVRLKPLETVHGVVSINSFVPKKQDEKLAIITELRELLQPEFWTVTPSRRVDPEEEYSSLEDFAEKVTRRASADTHARALNATLKRYTDALRALPPDKRSEEFGALSLSLFSSLEPMLAKLQLALSTGDIVTEAGIPEEIRAQWIAGDGRYRVEILPEEDLTQNGPLLKFVSEVRSIVPGATGSPVIFVEASRAVIRAFRQALLTALAGMMILLFFLFRRARIVLFVMLPLILGGLFTCAFSVLFRVPFNFANIIVLPLLVGAAGDNGIHVMDRHLRHGTAGTGELLKSTTSRAIIFSALTTAGSMGNMMLSSHAGMASMGSMLTAGLIINVVCTLLILPTFLARWNVRGA